MEARGFTTSLELLSCSKCAPCLLCPSDTIKRYSVLESRVIGDNCVDAWKLRDYENAISSWTWFLRLDIITVLYYVSDVIMVSWHETT